LLVAVRDAMHRIDDAIVAIGEAQQSQIRIAGDPAWFELLVLHEAALEGVEVEHVERPPFELRDALLDGRIDLARSEAPLGDDPWSSPSIRSARCNGVPIRPRPCRAPHRHRHVHRHGSRINSGG
jgi:hypothetical protein